MIEISDSTATRRSERKMGKGRRAIDATTMMGMGGIRLVAVARVVEFGPAGDDTRLSCRQCFSSAILGQRDTHSKISEMVILVGIDGYRVVHSRLFSSCEGTSMGRSISLLMSYIRYQGRKERMCRISYFYFYFISINYLIITLSSTILRRVPTS